MQEASETQYWLEFANSCHYLNQDQFKELDDEYERIIAMLNEMERQAARFCYKS